MLHAYCSNKTNYPIPSTPSSMQPTALNGRNEHVVCVVPTPFHRRRGVVDQTTGRGLVTTRGLITLTGANDGRVKQRTPFLPSEERLRMCTQAALVGMRMSTQVGGANL